MARVGELHRGSLRQARGRLAVPPRTPADALTRPPGHRLALALTLAAPALTLVACGAPADFANDPRPPATVQVDAAIAASRVVLSPDHLGAGQIELIVANETGSAQRVTLQGTSPGAPGAKTATIGPGALAQIDAILASGEYTLSTGDAGIAAARLSVGAERPSAQDQLLQP